MFTEYGFKASEIYYSRLHFKILICLIVSIYDTGAQNFMFFCAFDFLPNSRYIQFIE